ncbi:MAG: DNA polymerase Y family protein [Tahibacter sp.]
MLWACLQFPQIALIAVYGEETLALRPCAVSDGLRQRPSIYSTNTLAMRAGIRNGLSLAASLALCSELAVRPRDYPGERQILQLLAAWAYRFSAQICVIEPDTLLVEIGASLTLFEGWPALKRRLCAELLVMGFADPAFAVAPVAAAARVLVRSDNGIALRHLPVMQRALGQAAIAVSGLPNDIIVQLQGMGFHRLCELFALPRVELTRRIGPANLHWLDQLRGDVPENLPSYQPPSRYERRIELDSHIHNWQILLFPLNRLIRELALFLLLRDGGVQGFELVLEHESLPATRVMVGLLSIQREADALFDFARGRLERCTIPADVSAISLLAADLPVFRPGHRDLFEPVRVQGMDWPDLTERLRSRLGDDALHGLTCVEEHRPELAWQFAPLAGQHTAPSPQSSSFTLRISSLPAPQDENVTHDESRPLWLLSRPIPLRQPPVEILAGPERIESGWWDGQDARRDYYVVRSLEGQRVWAFLPVGTQHGWMLHGWFA